MRWQELFEPVPGISAREAKELLDTTPLDGVQLVDVRQPWEFERGRLPGARLLPLRQLMNDGDPPEGLDPLKPTIVYCASGSRSQAAAQWLQGQGFSRVYNLNGGINAWQHPAARGPLSPNLHLFPQNADFSDASALAYVMEENLQRFYRRLRQGATDPRVQEMLDALISFEERHKTLLRQRRREAGADGEVGNDWTGLGLEGGGSPTAMLEAAEPLLESREGVLHLAMALEIQAMDFYLRLAQRSRSPAARTAFLGLAEEERGHFTFLEGIMDQLGNPPTP